MNVFQSVRLQSVRDGLLTPGVVMLCLMMPLVEINRSAAAPPVEKSADQVAPGSVPQAGPGRIDAWIDMLTADSYLRRQRAIRELRRVGAPAVPALVTALDRGDLETTEQAIKLLQEIAMEQPFLPNSLKDRPSTAASPSGPVSSPDREGPDAWLALKNLATTGGGRGARAALAMSEVRRARRDASVDALTREGVYIGIADFVIRSTSTQKRIVQVDDGFTGTDATLSLLQWIDSVSYARVKGSAIRPATLRAIVSMPDLQTLQLLQGEVDAEALQVIGQSAGVRHLEFRYVPLSGEMIDAIAKLPIRVSLTLNGTGAPVQRVDALKAALPGLLVDFKQGGFLGVRCTDGFNACRINDVVPQSGAETAGLLPGDVITALNDKPITRFAELQEQINEHMPGDTLHIRFLRDGEEASATAKLGQLVEG